LIEHWTEIAGLLAALCWAIGGMIFSRLPLGVGAMNAGKNTVGTVLLLVFIALSSRGFETLGAIGGDALLLLAISGFVGITIGDASYLRSIQLLGPRRALVVSTLGPPISGVLGWIFFAEFLSLEQLLGMAATLIGVSLVVWERSGPLRVVEPAALRPGLIHGLIAALCQAVGAALARMGMAGLDPVDPTAAFVRIAVATAIGWGLALLTQRGGRWARELLAPGVRGRIFIASSIGTFLGIWLSLIAIGVLELATASTQTSTAPIFMTILVAVVWREQVTRRAWIATAIAVLGVVLLVQAS